MQGIEYAYEFIDSNTKNDLYCQDYHKMNSGRIQ